MNRTVAGAAVGAGVGVFALAAVGAVYGYEQGVETARVPPGAAAAARMSVIAVGFLGWMAAMVGGAVGGVAGFGSWLVRRKH